MQRPVVGIIQARMGSVRFPGKVLKPILGYPLLQVLLERVRTAKSIDLWVVATSDMPEDDAIEALVNRMNVACFRGSEKDVLDRYYQAAKRYEAQIVGRLTADNPLVECAFVDWVAGEYAAKSSTCDFAYTSHHGLPLGMSMEIFPMQLLERLWHEDSDIASREHVTTMLYNEPQQYHGLALQKSLDYAGMRWTVDEIEDYQFICKLFESIGQVQFSWEEAAALLKAHPAWSEINRHVRQRGRVVLPES